MRPDAIKSCAGVVRSRFRLFFYILAVCRLMILAGDFRVCEAQRLEAERPPRKATALRVSSEMNELVEVRRGNLPVIISAPHGGHLGIDKAPLRTGKAEGIKQFATVRDGGTDQLAKSVSQAIERKSGRRPHLIVAHFSRRFVDANRPAEWAYESEPAGLVYEAYHESIRRARDWVLEEFGRGILIDIHAQGADRDTIFRGTRNKATVKHMLSKFGEEAFEGKRSIPGLLTERGYRIFPAPGDPAAEHKSYNGGYITGTYGSMAGGTIDSIQLEFGYNQRSPERINQTAEDLSDALIIYTREYLETDQGKSAKKADQAPATGKVPTTGSKTQ